MTIEDDLIGVVVQNMPTIAENTDIVVSNNGGGSYTITSDAYEDIEDLDCNLSGSSLRCSDDNENDFSFKKGSK